MISYRINLSPIALHRHVRQVPQSVSGYISVAEGALGEGKGHVPAEVVQACQRVPPGA